METYGNIWKYMEGYRKIWKDIETYRTLKVVDVTDVTEEA